jgi:hypothetical protein
LYIKKGTITSKISNTVHFNTLFQNGVIRGILLSFQYMGQNNNKIGGVVVNIASAVGLDPSQFIPIYCGTKHGVVGLSKSFGVGRLFFFLHIILLSEMVSRESGYHTQRSTCYASGHSTNVTIDLQLLIREYADSNISIDICLLCPTFIVVFLSPSVKCGIEIQNSLNPIPSTLYLITCSISPWHLTGRLNKSTNQVTPIFLNQVGSISPAIKQPFIFSAVYENKHLSRFMWPVETSYRSSV